ncbi:transcriptional regulator [Listeria monocytogenes]|nr:transcriptional regulator [Listeria monocytogenes]
MKKDVYLAGDQSITVSMMLLRMIAEESRWYTVNELSERLDMNQRTMQRYIADLLEKIEDYNDPNIQLYTAKNKGVFLEITLGADVLNFELYLLEENVTIILMKAIFFEEFTSVKKFAMDYFLSETTIRRSLKYFQELLEPYGIKLKRETYEVVGPEEQVRMFFYSYFWRLYQGAIWPFDIVNHKMVEEATMKVTSSLRQNLTYVQQYQIEYVIAINIIRIRKRHLVELKPNWKNYLDLNNDFKSLTKIKAVFESLNIQKESEIYFFYLLMETRPKLYENKEVARRALEPHKKNNSDVYAATEVFIRVFSEEMAPIPQKKYDLFFNSSFSAHLFCTLFKHFSGDINGYEYIRKFKEYYPKLHQKMDELLDILYEETGNELFLEKDFLLTRYGLLFSSIKRLTYFEEEIQIVLDTDLPKFAELNLRHQIFDSLKYRYKVHFLNKNSAPQADVILTTVATPMMVERYNREKVLHIGAEPSARDFYNIVNIVVEAISTK